MVQNRNSFKPRGRKWIISPYVNGLSWTRRPAGGFSTVQKCGRVPTESFSDRYGAWDPPSPPPEHTHDLSAIFVRPPGRERPVRKRRRLKSLRFRIHRRPFSGAPPSFPDFPFGPNGQRMHFSELFFRKSFDGESVARSIGRSNRVRAAVNDGQHRVYDVIFRTRISFFFFVQIFQTVCR